MLYIRVKNVGVNIACNQLTFETALGSYYLFALRVWKSSSNGSAFNRPVFCFRRPTPYGNQTDYRIYELNKRLQNWTEVRVTSSITWRVIRTQHQTVATQKHRISVSCLSWFRLQSVALHSAAPVNYLLLPCFQIFPPSCCLCVANHARDFVGN